MMVENQLEIISRQDQEVADAMAQELKRQRGNIELIASENIVSEAVLAAVGSVLTLTNSIGFGISIASILLFVSLAETVALGALLPWLALGPALGLWALRPLLREEQQRSAAGP